MIKRMDRFIEYVDDEDFKDDYFDIPLYKKAVAKHGQLAYDECFGFVPLLALGGFKEMCIRDSDEGTDLTSLLVIGIIVT